MTNNTNSADAAKNTITSAQLFWDTADRDNQGWWLRYTDTTGTEQGDAIDGDEDAKIAELAISVATRIPAETGRVTVLRGEQRRGWFDVADGVVAGWRVL